MAPKFLFFHMLLAAAILSAVQLEAGGVSAVIHITSTVTDKSSPQINIQLKAGGSLKGSALLSPGQTYKINGDVSEVYYASAVFGLRFAAFHAYEPARDKGRAAIYWKADKDGFSVSYDNIKWKEVAPWESE